MIEQWPILVVGLPPAIANVLLLLIFLIALWLTLVRPLEKWLDTHSRYTEEERRQYWLALKAIGRGRFAWRFGVFRWGLPAFAISTPLMLLWGREPSAYDIATVGLVCLTIWTFVGYWFGRYVWQGLPKK